MIWVMLADPEATGALSTLGGIRLVAGITGIERLRQARREGATAMVVVPGPGLPPDAALAAAYRDAGVPVVESHAVNLERLEESSASAGAAAAVVHGFGERSHRLAVEAARRLAEKAGRGGETDG